MSIKKISNFFSRFNEDNLREFINKYLSQIIYTIVFILILSFVLIFRINKKDNANKELIANYYRAINYISENKQDEALNLLNLVYNSKYADDNIKTISGLRLADILNSSGKQTEAVVLYEEIYNLRKNDIFLKNLSGLAILNIMINENNEKNYSKIEELIKKLNNSENPLLLLVNEQEGMFEIQRGNNNKGIEILKNALREEVDEDTRNRINSVLSIYGDL